MTRRITTLFALTALAAAGCGDDDGGTRTTDDMGTTTRDMGTTTGDDMGTTTGDDMGTSTRAPEGALSDARDFNAEVDEANCTCDMGGFDTVEACVAFGGAPADYDACEAMAYADNLATQGPSQVCFADALEVYASCVTGAACDDGALEGCFNGLVSAAGDCPEGSEAYFTAVEACVATHITGDAAAACPDETLTAGTVGAEVATGTTLLAGDDFALGCNDGGAPDLVYAWTAPATASYVIDTVGSSYDTALAVFDSCTDGMEIDCNDDTTDLFSEITLEAMEGTTYFIVVDGYDATSAGDFVLNIAEAPPAAG